MAGGRMDLLEFFCLVGFGWASVYSQCADFIGDKVLLRVLRAQQSEQCNPRKKSLPGSWGGIFYDGVENPITTFNGDYMFLRYLPPTSYRAWEIWPRLQC